MTNRPLNRDYNHYKSRGLTFFEWNPWSVGMHGIDSNSFCFRHVITRSRPLEPDSSLSITYLESGFADITLHLSWENTQICLIITTPNRSFTLQYAKPVNFGHPLAIETWSALKLCKHTEYFNYCTCTRSIIILKPRNRQWRDWWIAHINVIKYTFICT
jgi:hypothetical protein